jgi:serine/threonine protein kinase
VLVTDFGLHVVGGDAAFPGLAGTASYMAPEQIDPARGSIGPWTDVYGLGAVLFALLTGRAPHTGGTVREILDCVLSSPQPPDPRLERADVPGWLAEACLRSLQGDPTARYASADELRRALAGYG